MAKNFSLGKINLTGNPVSPGGGGGPSGYFTPEIMQLLGQNAPTPQMSGMDKFKAYFQNPQVQQSLQGLAPLLFGAFGGPEMGAGALQGFNTQDAIRRQQEEIDAERRQREAALGISRERLGLEKEKITAETEAAKATAAYKSEQDRIDRITKASNAFESGLTGIDTSDAQKVTTYALSKARLHGLDWNDTKLFVEQAQARAGLPPVGKKPEPPLSIGGKGQVIPGVSTEPGATSVTGLDPSIVKMLVEQRGGLPGENKLQRIAIENPNKPKEPLFANYDPNTGGVYSQPDAEGKRQQIGQAKPFLTPAQLSEPLYVTATGAGGMPVYSYRSQAAGAPAARTLFEAGGGVSLGGVQGASTVAPPPFTAEQGQAVRGLQNLQFLMQDVMTQMQAQPTLGPLVGRLKLAEIDKLGGAGATPAEIKLATSLNNLITNKAFSEGGKQLTPTEQERFTKMLPSLSDTMQQAMIKLQLAYAFLNEQQANLYSTITPRTLGQYPGLQQPGAGAGPAAGELRYNPTTKKLEPVQ